MKLRSANQPKINSSDSIENIISKLENAPLNTNYECVFDDDFHVNNSIPELDATNLKSIKPFKIKKVNDDVTKQKEHDIITNQLKGCPVYPIDPTCIKIIDTNCEIIMFKNVADVFEKFEPIEIPIRMQDKKQRKHIPIHSVYAKKKLRTSDGSFAKREGEMITTKELEFINNGSFEILKTTPSFALEDKIIVHAEYTCYMKKIINDRNPVKHACFLKTHKLERLNYDEIIRKKIKTKHYTINDKNVVEQFYEYKLNDKILNVTINRYYDVDEQVVLSIDANDVSPTVFV